jgi:hypothetical protein
VAVGSHGDFNPFCIMLHLTPYFWHVVTALRTVGFRKGYIGGLDTRKKRLSEHGVVPLVGRQYI